MAELLWWRKGASETTSSLLVRSDTSGVVTLEIGGWRINQAVDTSIADGTVLFTVYSLRPGTQYSGMLTQGGSSVPVRMSTLPSGGHVRFTFSSCTDIANFANVAPYNKHNSHGVLTLASWPADFAIQAGDLSYMDYHSGAFSGETLLPHSAGPSYAEAIKHYRVIMRAPYLTRLCHNVQGFYMWDDHEVENGGKWAILDYPGISTTSQVTTIFDAFGAAWDDYSGRGNPENRDAPIDAGARYYRFTVGRAHDGRPLVEVWVPDHMTYQTPWKDYASDGVTAPADTSDGAGLPLRYMLGTTQRNWLIDTTLASDAWYKVWALEKGRYYPDHEKDPANQDGWWSYRFEWDYLMRSVLSQGVRPIIFCGDWHQISASESTESYGMVVTMTCGSTGAREHSKDASGDSGEQSWARAADFLSQRRADAAGDYPNLDRQFHSFISVDVTEKRLRAETIGVREHGRWWGCDFFPDGTWNWFH